MRCLLLVVALCWIGAPVIAQAADASDKPATDSARPADPAAEQFFETRVRPLLASRCFGCHGEKKQESSLRLDSRQAVLTGGDNGRAVVVGKPAESPLVKAVRREGDVVMPPEDKDKLSAEEVGILEQWIAQGLAFPGGASSASSGVPTGEARFDYDRQNHWAYQPIRQPQEPQVKLSDWIARPLDRFVLARQEAAGLSPSPPADKYTLIRRATFDLTGLPPTATEVEAFVNDAAPDAYERLVDRLLESPRYGERWGRHWLDVARYGDSKGYAFARERRYPYAYTYRDWVIEAFNRDLPYDQFLLLQLAADRLPHEPNDPNLAALGLLTVGRKFNNRNDDLDDQVDVVTRGLMGLTVACARCHDHKYDAIPTEDYYSLYGVFANCREPDDLPMIGTPEQSAANEKFQQELQKRQRALDEFVAEKKREEEDRARRRVAAYLARVVTDGDDELLDKMPAFSIGRDDLRRRLIDRWKDYLRDKTGGEHAVFGPWHELLALADEGFADKATEVLARWEAKPEGTNSGQLNPLVKAALAAEPPASKLDVARVYGQLLEKTYAQSQQQDEADRDRSRRRGRRGRGDRQLSPQEQLLQVLLADGTPTDLPDDDLRRYFNRADRNRYSELKKKIEEHQVNSPAAPPRAMVVVDVDRPGDQRVLIRGNPRRPGETVPRHFLRILAGKDRSKFSDGSGRLDLARAIVDPANPLTARVIVNRVWMHHFGEPLVSTPSDFGVRSDPPTQPEVLDQLSRYLIDNGWSLKKLHRQIMLSATYQQASDDRPECRKSDPENRLLWRANRRRMGFEATRDALLYAAGRLDETRGGRPVDIVDPKNRRRTVYGEVDRQDLPNLYRAFDFASPDQSSPRRPQTSVPQQALFLINSPFVAEQAQALAALPEVASADAPQAKARALYRAALARDPDAEELAIAVQFAAAARNIASGAKLNPWEQFAQVLLVSNEFLFVD